MVKHWNLTQIHPLIHDFLAGHSFLSQKLTYIALQHVISSQNRPDIIIKLLYKSKIISARILKIVATFVKITTFTNFP